MTEPTGGRLLFGALVAVGCMGMPRAPLPTIERSCVPVATWVDPATRRPVSAAAVVEAARRRRIVLLGERHDWYEDHRWQAHVLSVLHAAHPRLIVGFEAFTPAADPVLARWTAAAMSADEMLDAAGWRDGWGMQPDLYLPLFHLGRLLDLELRGLNVERDIVRTVGRAGFAGLSAAARARIAPPRPPSPAHRLRLAAAWEAHGCQPVRDPDPAFERFVEAQRTWDAAMARSLEDLAVTAPDAIVVGIVGRGHVEYGDGIPADLRARGVDPLVLLPWESTRPCVDLPADVADLVFGIAPLADEIPPRPPSRCPEGAAQVPR